MYMISIYLSICLSVCLSIYLSRFHVVSRIETYSLRRGERKPARSKYLFTIHATFLVGSVSEHLSRPL